MVTLYLLRHARASAQTIRDSQFSAERYDSLDAQGMAQARLLGMALSRRERGFDCVVCGPMQRHVETLRLLRQASPALVWPEPESCAGLREMPFDSLIRAHLPELLRDPEWRALWREVERQPADARIGETSPLARVLGEVARAWRAGQIAATGLETWDEFRERVRAALHDLARRAILANGDGEVLVVSSLGVISCMLALAAGDGAAPLRWLFTSSLSRVVVDDRRAFVRSVNDVDHLSDQPALMTVL
jgi:broad specificity phosphatase PhoE